MSCTLRKRYYYLACRLGWLRAKLNTDTAGFVALGRVRRDDPGERYCPTVLALRARRHGHGRAAGPGTPREDAPAGPATGPGPGDGA